MKRKEIRELKSDEVGAFSILLSILLGTGLLLIIATIVLDGGQMMSERRVLKNVAESSALALAAECSSSLSACNSSNTPEDLARENSPDRKTAITEVCIQGLDVRRNSAPCRPISSTSLDCAVVPNTSNYVRVRTQTLTKENTSFLKSLFGAKEGYEVNACAQAAWGAASSAQIYAPIALSICDWDLVLSGNRVAQRTSNSKLSAVACDFQSTSTSTRVSLIGAGRQENPSWAAIDLMNASLQDRKATSLCPDLNSQTAATLKVNDVLNQLNASGNASKICPDSKLGERMCSWLGQRLMIPLVSILDETSGSQIIGSTKFKVQAFTQLTLQAFSIKESNGVNRSCTGQGNGNSGGNGNGNSGGNGNGNSGGNTATPTEGGNPPNGNSNWCTGTGDRICLYGEFSTPLSPDSDLGIGNSNPNIGVRAIKLI